MNTSTSFPGFSSPAAGPEAPLDMLSACHTRVEKQCKTLERLLAHLPIHGCDAQAQEAAQAILRYFDSAARHHHQDEEQDLFPAMIEAMAGSDAVCIRDLTMALMVEHRQLEQRWHALRQTLIEVAKGQLTPLSTSQVLTFTQAYRDHIQREDKELLPMAARLLGDHALESIGQAMRARRGL